ncbi:MAG: hypothetical protein OWU84_13010 [Firmicutes bacterium]|nr:hypothetical protein [Bacillota bacterium]
MRVSVRQVLVTFAAMILTVTALLVGQRLYQATAVNSPLLTSLGAIPGVRRARVTGSTVTIALDPHANLMQVYEEVSAAATHLLGDPPARIVVVNHPDPTLTNLANNVAFVVAQGEATGQFVAMKNTIQSMATHDQVSAVVELGTRHLYLTFRHQGHVLYDVFPLTIGGVNRA